MTQNIVNFPKDRIVRDETPEEIESRVKRRQISYINGLVEDFSKSALMNLYMSGIDLSDKAVSEKFALTIECLRATLYASMDQEHPLHKQMETIIDDIRSHMKPQPSMEEVMEEVNEELTTEED